MPKHTFIALMALISPTLVHASCVEFSSTLRYGDNSDDVRRMQQVLNSDPATRVSESGTGSKGYESTYFGPNTRTALKKFQTLYREEILGPSKLLRPSGIAGENTRKKLASLSCNVDTSAPAVSDTPRTPAATSTPLTFSQKLFNATPYRAPMKYEWGHTPDSIRGATSTRASGGRTIDQLADQYSSGGNTSTGGYTGSGNYGTTGDTGNTLGVIQGTSNGVTSTGLSDSDPRSVCESTKNLIAQYGAGSLSSGDVSVSSVSPYYTKDGTLVVVRGRNVNLANETTKVTSQFGEIAIPASASGDPYRTPDTSTLVFNISRNAFRDTNGAYTMVREQADKSKFDDALGLTITNSKGSSNQFMTCHRKEGRALVQGESEIPDGSGTTETITARGTLSGFDGGYATLNTGGRSISLNIPSGVRYSQRSDAIVDVTGNIRSVNASAVSSGLNGYVGGNSYGQVSRTIHAYVKAIATDGSGAIADVIEQGSGYEYFARIPSGSESALTVGGYITMNAYPMPLEVSGIETIEILDNN